MIKKLVLAAAMSVAALLSASAASATAYDFVIFKNNTTETFVKGSYSMTGGTWATLQPTTNPAGGTKNGYYTAPNQAYTSYQDSWSASDGTSCSFWSYAQQNSFGNMQFYNGNSKSGARSGTIVCSGTTPGSNLDGSYDFNYSVSGF